MNTRGITMQASSSWIRYITCFCTIPLDIHNNHAFFFQPLNVGYSYGKGGPLDSVTAAKDVYALLQLFFKEFPQYADLDFHVAGESCECLTASVSQVT